MRRIGRVFGSSSSSSSSRPAENDQRRDRDAGRSGQGSEVNPRLAGLPSRPASRASRPTLPPRPLSAVEQAVNRDIHNEILPNLINVRAQCEHNPELRRTYQRADRGVRHAQKRLAGDISTSSRDELAEMLAKCTRELEASTGTQYQAVEASEPYRPAASTLPGSDAQVSSDVMETAMNLLYGFETTINPVRMNDWQKTQVGNLLRDIAANKSVSHAAVYCAYQNRSDPRALIEALVAHVSR